MQEHDSHHPGNDARHPAQSGDQDTAIETYKRALDLNRRNVDAYVARGAAYANISQFTKAIADFDTAIGEPPLPSIAQHA